MLLYIVEAKKGCKKKGLNILSLAADLLKCAQVTPIFKEDDPVIEKNYRPVSILPTLSKIYERLLSYQVTDHFNTISHDFLSAFRASYGCQTTLLRLVEDWKQALDKTCT